jgi:K+-sensing histidine kinase KdpD
MLLASAMNASLARWQTWAVILVSLAAMAFLDLVTGQELVFSCAYLIPVSLTAWWKNRRATVAMAFLSGVTSFVVDKFDGYEYSNPAINYFNAFTCFLIAVITGVILTRLKQALHDSKRMNQELRTALEQLEASTHEIRALQDGLQTVCAWTKKIKVDDVWMSPDEFLSQRLHLKLSHGISPEAYEQVRGEMKSATRTPSAAA